MKIVGYTMGWNAEMQIGWVINMNSLAYPELKMHQQGWAEFKYFDVQRAEMHPMQDEGW